MAIDWRRRHTRMACFLPSYINYSVLINVKSEGGGGGDGWGVIQDISMGGIRIETRVPIQVGQAMFISFGISDNFTFANTKCVVKRITRIGIYYICGLEFVNLVDRQHLKDALEHMILFDNE
ncbi:MAG: PilZ domain-containing protein [Elusimicrobiota bacterium]